MEIYGCTRMSDELQKLYSISMKELNGKKYSRDSKVYTGTIINFTIVDIR